VAFDARRSKSVDISGVTKGKGFAGTMKKYHFGADLLRTVRKDTAVRGLSVSTPWPSHVYRGKKMPGQMGNENATVLGRR
jgi:large subunit ribosomal protein L3